MGMDDPFFPVDLDDLPVKLEIGEMHHGSDERIGMFRVRAVQIFHPAPALAYRVEADGRSVVYATDTEDPFSGKPNPNLVGRDLAGPVEPAHVGRGFRHRQVGRVALDHPLDQVDLLQRRLHGFERLEPGRHPNRPELAADVAPAQPRQIGHQRRVAGGRRELRSVGRQVDGVEPILEARLDLLGQVVVAVDQGRLLQNARHPRLEVGGQAEDGEGEGGREVHPRTVPRAGGYLPTTNITPSFCVYTRPWSSRETGV